MEAIALSCNRESPFSWVPYKRRPRVSSAVGLSIPATAAENLPWDKQSEAAIQFTEAFVRPFPMQTCRNEHFIFGHAFWDPNPIHFILVANPNIERSKTPAVGVRLRTQGSDYVHRGLWTSGDGKGPRGAPHHTIRSRGKRPHNHYLGTLCNVSCSLTYSITAAV